MNEPQFFILDDGAGKRQRIVRVIEKLPTKDGQIWDVTIKPWRPRRSLDANRRLWALHKLAAESTGHSIEEMHEFCKAKFLPRAVVNVGDEKREVLGSSARLNKKAFAEFMEQTESFYIQELGVFLGDTDV